MEAAASSSEVPEAKANRRRRPPLSLSIAAQVAVIKLIHKVAGPMESEYIETWLEGQLTAANKEYEQRLNIRHPSFDPESVVRKYKLQEAELMLRKKEELERTIQKRLGKSSPSSSPIKTKRSTRSSRRTAPYKLPDKHLNEKLLQTLKPKVVCGIPEGIGEADFIEYRKCKYIQDIKSVRSFLVTTLSPGALNDLMLTMYNMSLYNNKHEHGLLTLQAMLTSDKTTDFRIAPAKFHRNFTIRSSSATSTIISSYNKSSDPMESRIGTTILHFAMTEGSSLTHLNLGKCCCDSVLEVVADKAANLRYLNISGSIVTDKGLFALCGVEKANVAYTRPRLKRACKKENNLQEKLVANQMPNWAKKRRGCSRLRHFEGENLQSLSWPAPTNLKYFDYPSVPLDCAFVAMLAYLSDLDSFITEVGGRAIMSYNKVFKKVAGCNDRELKKLQVLSESHPTTQCLKMINRICPNLRHLQVEWYEFFTPQNHHREEWLCRLQHCRRLTQLHTIDIDYKTEKLQRMLESIGHNLTVLDFRELWMFKYSNLRSVKANCPNLVSFALVMTTKNIVTSINQIHVDKDHNLQLNGYDRLRLSHLESLHLSGPFGSEVPKYLLSGADNLRSLTLGIEWLDLAFCDNQPTGRRDLVGKEYLDEIMSVNALSKLEEIHLMAQYRKGRHRLTKACADFVLDNFKALRHLGNFQFWNMGPSEVYSIIAQARSRNLDVTFDEDLFTATSDRPVFEYNFIPGRTGYACNHIDLRKHNGTSELSDFFELLAAPPGFLSDDDDDDSSVDLETDEEDLEDQMFEIDEGPINLAIDAPGEVNQQGLNGGAAAAEILQGGGGLIFAGPDDLGLHDNGDDGQQQVCLLM